MTASNSPDHSCRIRFWGVRGSIPTPGPSTVHYGGNTSCVEVRADDEIIVLDAGTGIRLLGLALAEEFASTPINLTLLITHAHWDHIQGFPFFLPAYQAKNNLRVLGYEGARFGLATMLAGQMESPYFPVSLGEMPGNIHIEELQSFDFAIGKVRAHACAANHPGLAVGYRLVTSFGSIAYFPDNEPFSPAQTGCAPETADARNQKFIEFIRETDVLIIDSQYDCDEYRTHIGWGHGCLDEVVQLAVSAGVKQLFLFHHDPNHDDEKVTAMLVRARDLASTQGSTMKIEAACEGAEVLLTHKA